ncbi:DUF29 domain-containing protein [Larkinella humicola]|uniref:DUF29 domain-containing protein n=1 Tax=Larkinella humicola TaxID=2607654 RepID=A0A5N1JDK2_9BACT|nr:DUF29 domain-containing protein [Larkinella humicola]KAA9353193.1 DUF29 domain-containing protein [Larkinella humicola]
MKPDWQDLVITSHLDTVETIRKLIEDKEYEEAMEGLDELYENMSNADKRALESQLVRLMVHILKWRYQPQKRSTSWVRTIVNARREIQKLQKYMPSLNVQFIENNWQESFEDATEEAKAEMNLSRKDKFEPAPLTWQEVFEDEYLL